MTGPQPGTAYLVGAGPGDPGLVTRRALELVQGADVLLVDKLVPAWLVAEARVDAELLAEPVQDGDRWSVLWRRQSMKPVDRGLDMEAPLIRPILAHDRGETKARALVEKLRADFVTDLNPDVVDMLEVSSTGDLQPVRRPGTMQARKPLNAQPIPAPGTMR